ncbi:site-2 protease family protein [Plantactinospora siamensis]|uniref:Site-2 protease family protein n=1 Tax=Plantactinospora siamensis TaxID=555372 RepID=A0ABV6P1V6_9ACTN
MEQTGRRRMPGRDGLPIGRVLGVPVRLSPSMALLAVLVTVAYGGMAGPVAGASRLAGYLFGLLFVACLAASVLLHELGHAVTARRHGIGVRGITLDLLGGYTELDREAPEPRTDLRVSLAGPAVSLALGALAVGAAALLPDGTVPDRLAVQLAASNLVVAVFNVLPGLPLDGGRALRAVVWRITRDRHRATEVAGLAGRGVALVVLAGMLALTLVGVLRPVALILMLVVAGSLWQGAGQAVRVARIARRAPLVDLRRLVRPVLTVPSGTPLAEAQRRAGSVAGPPPATGTPASGTPAAAPPVAVAPGQDAPHRAPAPSGAGSFGGTGSSGGPASAGVTGEPDRAGGEPAALVATAGPGAGPATVGVSDAAGRLVALVDRTAAAAVPPERRPWIAVDAVSRRLEAVPRLAVGLRGEQLLRAVQDHPGAQYVVTSGEDVVGVLHLDDLARVLEPTRKMT